MGAMDGSGRKIGDWNRLMDNDYASFLIRSWREDSEGDTFFWHSELESIQTGQKWQFTDLQTLCDFLQARVRGESLEPGSPMHEEENGSDSKEDGQ